MTDPNAFLMSGGASAPSASFLKIGDRHEGEIIEPAPRITQQRDFESRALKFWDDGSPMMQLVVTLQTDENDPEIEDDDGKRSLYLKYMLRDAVANAVKETGAKGLELGGWLSVAYVSQDKPKRRGAQGAKQFEAVYEPPDPNAAATEFLAEEEPEEVDETPAPPARRSRATAAKPAAKPARTRGRPARQTEDAF